MFWWYAQAVKQDALNRLNTMADYVATFGPMVAGKDAKLDAFVEQHRGTLSQLAGLATRRNT